MIEPSSFGILRVQLNSKRNLRAKLRRKKKENKKITREWRMQSRSMSLKPVSPNLCPRSKNR